MSALNLRYLTFWYVFALSLVALLAVGFWFSLGSMIKEAKDQESFLKEGQQLLLNTNRVTYQTKDLMMSERPEDFASTLVNLNDSIRLTELNYQRLAARQHGLQLNLEIAQAYGISSDEVDQELKQFLSEAHALANLPFSDFKPENPHLHYMLGRQPFVLQGALEILIKQKDRTKTLHYQRLEERSFWMLGITLLVLLLEALFIFRPLGCRILKEKLLVETSQKKLSAVFESIHEALFTINPQGLILTANNAAGKMWKTTPGEMVGQAIETFFTTPDFWNQVETTARAQSEMSRQISDAIHPLTQTRFPAEISVSYTRAGEEDFFTLSVRDLTASRRREIILQKAHEMAEAGNRAKNEFLSNLSHEIRTPMNGILGMSGLLRDTSLTSAQKDYVDAIQQSSERLLATLSNVLDFAALESGRIDLARQPFSLSQAVEQAVELLLPLARKKNLNLTCSLDQHVPAWIIGDEERLRQIIWHLGENALKFTSAGEVQIIVCRNKAKGSQEVVTLEIVISDSGIGIPPEMREHIFESFAQVNSSITRTYGGNGLGLALARRLAERMEGEVLYAPHLPHGSTFTFKFKAAICEAPPKDKSQESDDAFFQRLGKILVVEDDPLNQQVILTVLRTLGFHPILASSGKEALALTGQENFDLVLLDLQMPEMDGFTVAKKIRESTPSGFYPMIIAVTGSAAPEALPQCLASGMDDCVLKPFRVSKLKEVILKQLHRRDTLAVYRKF